MRNMNCRTVRREIEEATTGKWLSSDVNNHVLSCVGCETLLREQTKLRELVSSLGTVEAPSDFDFRLRARLADEKRSSAKPLTFGNLLFGLRPVAAVSVLLLIGFALAFLSFRAGLYKSTDAGFASVAPTSGVGGIAVIDDSNKKPEPGKQDVIVQSGKTEQPAQKRSNGLRQAVAAGVRDTNRQSTRDSVSTMAKSLKRDQVAGVSSTPFPINGGYQSLRVSVDDERGISRTISLPSVSVGSQRSLSQGGSPLMASARGAW